MADRKQSFAAQFVAEPGKKFELAKCDPRNDGAFSDKDMAKTKLVEDAAAIDTLQNRLYAEGKRSLLVVLQGIDSSGKDGTIRAVFNASGPIGVTVTSFKAPSAEEMAHDYLWRIHKACPPRGLIGIFNRSHYEDVLVVKVKKFASPEAIERRYEEINQFEKLLSQNGTRILKFMLHISKDEQAERLRERIANPEKRWKFNPGDLADRALWNDYMAAYETAIARCSTPQAPWHVVPADRNWVRNAAIARIVRETLEDMDPKYPEPKDWDPAIKVV
ncbi:MAG: polyphosphate kinase 2 family protein [Rhizobiales bacterium]|nr:polyphosphate kinase 2 family protein [Hyphomicrobiales bacterium]